ncbi:MAG: hypothetical protein WD874_00435 [Parcubacteria group bacterium]
MHPFDSICEKIEERAKHVSRSDLSPARREEIIDEVASSHLASDTSEADKEEFCSKIRTRLIDRSIERVRAVTRRHLSTSSRAQFDHRELAAGAEVEDRLDRIRG